MLEQHKIYNNLLIYCASLKLSTMIRGLATFRNYKLYDKLSNEEESRSIGKIIIKYSTKLEKIFLRNIKKNRTKLIKVSAPKHKNMQLLKIDPQIVNQKQINQLIEHLNKLRSSSYRAIKCHLIKLEGRYKISEKSPDQNLKNGFIKYLLENYYHIDNSLKVNNISYLELVLKNKIMRGFYKDEFLEEIYITIINKKKKILKKVNINNSARYEFVPDSKREERYMALPFELNKITLLKNNLISLKISNNSLDNNNTFSYVGNAIRNMIDVGHDNSVSLRKITIHGIPCIYPLVRYNQYPQLEEIKLVISSNYMYDDSTENHIICGCTCIYCKQAEKLMTSNRYPKLKKVRVSCFNVTEITLELLKVIQKFSSEITLRS